MHAFQATATDNKKAAICIFLAKILEQKVLIKVNSIRKCQYRLHILHDIQTEVALVDVYML